jgi:hypothetical protein
MFRECRIHERAYDPEAAEFHAVGGELPTKSLP